MLPDEIRVNFTFRPKLLLVSPLAALLVAGAFFLPWGAESAPAWVQAVGSVAAILVAVGVAWHQARLQAKVAEDARVEALDKIVSTARYAGQLSLNFYSCVDQDVRDTKLLDQFEISFDECLQIFSQVGYLDLPGVEVSLGWIELRRCVREIKGRIPRLGCHDSMDGARLLEIKLNVDAILCAVKRVEQGAGFLDIPPLVPLL